MPEDLGHEAVEVKALGMPSISAIGPISDLLLTNHLVPGTMVHNVQHGCENEPDVPVPLISGYADAHGNEYPAFAIIPRKGVRKALRQSELLPPTFAGTFQLLSRLISSDNDDSRN